MSNKVEVPPGVEEYVGIWMEKREKKNNTVKNSPSFDQCRSIIAIY